MTTKKPAPAAVPQKAPTTPTPDQPSAPSAPEREADGDSYRKPEDYPAEERMTPPAIQTGAQRPTVVGQPPNADDPQVDPVPQGETSPGSEDD